MFLIGVTRKLSLLASCALRIYNRVMLLSAFFLFSLQLIMNWYVVPLRTTHIFADDLTFILFITYCVCGLGLRDPPKLQFFKMFSYFCTLNSLLFSNNSCCIQSSKFIKKFRLPFA